MRAQPRHFAVVPLLILAGSVSLAGPGVPGADYFKGLYERVGRDAAAGLVNDRIRIEPDGTSLSLVSCTAKPLSMSFAPWSLGENFLSTQSGSETVVCQFHNNGDNRPIFTCQSDRGTKLTLWPVEGGFRDGVLDCSS